MANEFSVAIQDFISARIAAGKKHKENFSDRLPRPIRENLKPEQQ
jgi:hypothetical protein